MKQGTRLQYYALTFTSLTLALFAFVSPVAAQSCGDFVYEEIFEGELYVERYPIEDCNNPFEVQTPPAFDFSFAINGTPIVNGGVFQVASTTPVQLSYSVFNGVINENENPLNPRVNLQLWRHEGPHYYYVGEKLIQSPLNLSSLPPGTYTGWFRHSFNGGGVQVGMLNTLLRYTFLPHIAYAYEPGTYRNTVTFTIEEPTIEPVGASSVLFLPGIKASRLYADGILGTENRLWEPNANVDVEKLEMTTNGQSVNDIYTRDILSKVFGVKNVYEGFTQYLNNLVSENTIEAWEAFAYDWRYDVFSVVENGTLQKASLNAELERVYPTEVLESLAATSKSGKVTIVAHSNGGLLAKAIMIKLEAEGKANLVDNIIFIGSPQLGTPKAIASILHGYDEALIGGWLVSDVTAREAVLNMPGAYGLLPTSKYVAATGKPLIQFDTSLSTEIFRNQYGNAINTADELRDFMIGSEGRPQAVSLYNAIIANAQFVSESGQYHETQLDDWLAPAGIGVTEIVGVGLDTENGFEYEEITKRICAAPDFLGNRECKNETTYRPIPQMTLFGDGTVVGNSAEGYEGKKDTFYFNLFLKDEFDHSNLTESDSIQIAIRNVLTKSADITPALSDQKPDVPSERTMFGVHSPVSIEVEDNQGNRVGLFNNDAIEEIPGSSYREIGGSKYVILPKSTIYSVRLKGQDEGGMTLTMHDLNASAQSESLKLPIAVVTASTSITFSNGENGLTNLLVDVNGDGIKDKEYKPSGEEVLPDLEVVITYSDLCTAIESLSIKKIFKKPLLLSVQVAEKMSLRSNVRVFKQIEKLLLHKIQIRIDVYLKKQLITTTEHQNLSKILQELSK